MTRSSLHKVSILVTHPDGEFDDELIADARYWFGDLTALEVSKHVVEVHERDLFGRPIVWRVSASVRPARGRADIAAA